jgi:GAF domain-containing protein
VTARILHAPIALITLIDAERQYFKAGVGLPEPWASSRETPLEYSICQYAVAMGAPLVICDAGVEHWLDDNPAVSQLGVRAYAGVPLITPEGYAIGTLCVVDVVPRSWLDEDLANLEDLAGAVMREVRLDRLERALRSRYGTSPRRGQPAAT